LIALVLSQNKGILDGFKQKSFKYCLRQRICAQQLPTSIYYASKVDKATQACFSLCHEIGFDPSKFQ